MMAFRTILRDERGATVVEFALLLPVILGGFLGVLQVGLSMMAYNGMRNITAEASRFALVEYQNSRDMDDWSDIVDYAEGIAPSAGLDKGKFELAVSNVVASRVDGAIEVQLTATYEVPSVVPFLGVNSFDATYSRPLFLIDES